MATSTLPARYRLDAYQGDAWSRQFAFKYRDSAGALQLLDTTGWTARMGIKARKSDTSYLLDSDAGQITLTTGIQGTAPHQYNLDVLISGTNTASLSAGLVGVYDIALIDTTGRETTMLHGQFCVEGQVSS